MAADLSHATFLYRADQERDFPIPDGPIVRIGFDRSNGVSIPFEGVSRNHARLSFDGKMYWIEDAGSSNGTLLNGRRVTKKQRIAHLDVVTLGRRTDLIFVRKQVIAAMVKQRGIRSAWLEALDGAEAGSRREVPRGSIILGRAPSSNVVIDSNLISKSHARLERSGLQLSLTDLQSANGTFVNGERVDSRVLANGDEINLGGSRTYRVHIEEGEVEVRESSAPLVSSAMAIKLPTDWKTRIEWTPEERAIFDEVRGVSPRGETALMPAAPEPPVAPPKPSSPAMPSKPAAPPSKPAAAPVPAKPSPAIPSPRPAAPPSAVATPEQSRPGPETRDVRPVPPPPASSALSPAPRPEPPAKPPAAPPPISQQMPASAPAPSEAPGRRVFLEGKTQTFTLGTGEHEVGRVPQCAVRLEGPQISRHHARLRVMANALIVEDLGSANGTFVNGHRIQKSSPVGNGDAVTFGDMSFRIRVASAAEAPRPEKA